MNYQPLTRSLRAALMDRNVCQVRALLAIHGLVAFCNALSGCSPRVIADVLSLLNDSSREAVLRHLHSAQRASLKPLGIALQAEQAAVAPQPASTARPAARLPLPLPWGGRRLFGMAL